jgi:hypothetical protein
LKIHRSNQRISVRTRADEALLAHISHVEENGKHTFVIASEERDQTHFRNLRGDLARMLKAEHNIQNNRDLDYIERQADGKLYQVNLDHLGPGPGIHGEPERLKDRGRWMGEEEVKARLGPAQLPETPRQERRQEHRQDQDLKDARGPQVSRHELRREQKPKM